MITQQLLERYFKQQCTAEERTLVEAYLDAGDHTLLDGFLQSKWKDAIENPSATITPPPITLPRQAKIRILGAGWAKYAAVCTGLLVLSTAIFYALTAGKKKAAVSQVARQEWKELDNRGSAIRSVVMGDGTKIWLNKNAVLRYPDNYNEATREVELLGEAYFEVAPDKSKPFRVHTAGITTTALGTAFNISVFTIRDTAIRVSLLEGKVAVTTAGAGDRILTPGMKVDFEDNQLMEPVQDSLVKQSTGWIKDKIYFNNTTLKEVCRRLSYQYNQQLTATETAGQQRISGTFNTSDDFKTIVAAITFVHQLQVTYTPSGCKISKE